MNHSNNYKMSTISFENPQETQNVRRMIQMLKNYEGNCLKKGNFFEAQASKLKIGQLKQHQLKFERQLFLIKNKENVEEVEKRNEKQVALFHQTWEQKVKQHLSQYKDLQQKLCQDHKRQLEDYQKTLSFEQPPKIKYSPSVLKMRSHLQNLIKCRQYIEAQHISKQLQSLEEQQNKTWIFKFQEKKKKQFQQLLKKQQGEMKALKLRIKTMFNQRIKQKEQLFIKLLNKIQKRKVESGKLPVQLKLKEQKLIKSRINKSHSTSKHNRSLIESGSSYFKIKSRLD